MIIILHRGKREVGATNFSETVKCTTLYLHIENSFWAAACLSLDNSERQMGNLQLERLTIYDTKRKKHQRFNKFWK